MVVNFRLQDHNRIVGKFPLLGLTLATLVSVQASLLGGRSVGRIEQMDRVVSEDLRLQIEILVLCKKLAALGH